MTKNRPLHRTQYFVPMLIGACSIAPLVPSHAAETTPANVLFSETFEVGSLAAWNIEKTLTDTSAQIVAGGQSSNSSLEIAKHDDLGYVLLSREFVATAGNYLRISADVQSLFVGPYAEYYIHTQQLDAGGKIVEQTPFAFNDGASVNSVFGGAYKTPQTLGEWKKTRHTLKMDAAAVKLRLLIIVRDGRQKLRFDNLQVENLGSALPPPQNLPFYEKSLDSASAFLTLDTLVPGFTYEITATTSTANLEGMGIAMSWLDRLGTASDALELLQVRADGNALIYRLSVPERAVAVRLDLHNEDLTTLGWNHEKDYRRWKTISIRNIATRPAPDTLFYNYTRNISSHPELSKPREMVDVSEYDGAVLRAHLAQRPTLDAQVKKINGGMAIQIGGEIAPPMMHASIHTLNRFDVYSELGKRGSNLIRVDNVKGGPALNGQWLAARKFDFSSVDTQIYAALKQNPDANIIFAIEGLYPPAWWGEANPDEILQDSQGLSLAMYDPYAYKRLWGKMQGDNRLRERVKKDGALYFPSPVSQPYRAAIKEYLTALRRYIEAQPYGKAIIGYQLTWGYDAQWGWPTTGSEDEQIEGKSESHLLDYSVPMTKYFREFLRRKYQTEGALQKAWNDPKVMFATATIPLPEQRQVKLPIAGQQLPVRFLLDPAKDARVIDFNLCYSEVPADLVNDLSQALKAAAPRQVLVTAYFQDTARPMGTDRVLGESGMDVSGGPSYEAREIGQSGLSPHVFSSYALHDKIEFTEVDHRVFSTIYRNYRGNQVFETPRKSISVLQREFARQMINGGGAWTLDMGMGWFAQPIIADTLGDIRRMWDKVLSVNRSSVAQMAMFVSDYSMQVEYAPQFLGRPYYLSQAIRVMMSQSGVPVDVYRISDLNRVANRYKVFLFPFAYGMTDAERASIETIKKNGNLLIFGPAAGYVGSRQMSAQNVISLTGMQMEQDDKLPFTVKITNSTHAITRNMRGFIGSDEVDHQRLSFPMFAVTDPKAVTLAQYTSDATKTTGKTGIAFKDNGTWQSVYIGAMGVFPTELMRGLARQKNLPIYSTDGDVMFINKSLIAVHASTDGVKTLELPAAASVTSLWDNKSLGTIKTLRREMKTGDNALYLLRPE